MKVIIKKTGQVKEVADGYATNHLFPCGLAVPATKEALAELERSASRKAKASQADASEWKALADKLGGATVTVVASANEDGTLFGAVSESAILKAMQKAGFEVEESWISLSEPVKQTGKHQVTITFPNSTTAQLTLQVNG